MNAKLAKKIRREVREMKYNLAAELKGYINSLGLKDRIILAVKIILRRRW